MHKKLIVWLMIVGSLFSLALANSAEPPGFTVIAKNAPEDLRLEVCLEGEEEQISLEGWKRLWEKYWSFYYHLIPGSKDIHGMVLKACSGEEEKVFSIPAEALRGYSHILTLDWEAGTLQQGQSPWRIPLLVALRVVLTLLIESVVLFLFGYRNGKSWLIFAVANLATQTFVNAAITGPRLGSYWMFGYLLMEILVFAAEMIVFGVGLREKGRIRAVLCAFAANAASLFLGGWLIANLPI